MMTKSLSSATTRGSDNSKDGAVVIHSDPRNSKGVRSPQLGASDRLVSVRTLPTNTRMSGTAIDQKRAITSDKSCRPLTDCGTAYEV